ncbi:MAG: fatty acid desaturase [Aggregatilineales bacterium]
MISTHEKPIWVKLVAKYSHSIPSVSIWQIVNSFGPYFALTILAYATIHISFLLTLPISILAGMFLMRVFIIQHDCGHQSFFKSKQANDRLGFVCGILTMTPYAFWRTAHAIHHATSGDLDFRGIGDVETKTVREYVAATPIQRLGYRLYRNPFIMFGFGPMYMFTINQRTPVSWRAAKTKQAKRSLIYTDLILLALWIPLIAVLGLGTVVKVQLPMYVVATTVGVWLFYVQHNFEDTYWRLHPEWTYEEAALKGSSYYKLPKVLQWFSGNIGLHHIHHLSPKIPNYLLQKAHDENEYFQSVQVLTLASSLRVLVSRLALWDEDQQKLVTFGDVHRRLLNAPNRAVPEIGTSSAT